MSPSTEQRETREFAAELKFTISADLADAIQDWARTRLGADPNGSGETGDRYEIASLYFDTRHFDVFHRHGSFGRSKYRIRRYGQSEVIFLERKLKTRNLVSKRRSIVTIDDLHRLRRSEPEREWAGYWFHRRVQARELEVVCEICYVRTARVSMTAAGPVRLTLDRDIRARRMTRMAFHQGSTGVPLLKDELILELKYLYAMPAVFKHLVEEFKLTPRPVSKYRLGAAVLGLATDQTAAGRELNHSICLSY